MCVYVTVRMCVHRGVCLSSRCAAAAQHGPSASNVAARFAKSALFMQTHSRAAPHTHTHTRVVHTYNYPIKRQSQITLLRRAYSASVCTSVCASDASVINYSCAMARFRFKRVRECDCVRRQLELMRAQTHKYSRTLKSY